MLRVVKSVLSRSEIINLIQDQSITRNEVNQIISNYTFSKSEIQQLIANSSSGISEARVKLTEYNNSKYTITLIHKEFASGTWFPGDTGTYTIYNNTIRNIDLSPYEFITILWGSNIMYPYPGSGSNVLEAASTMVYPVLTNNLFTYVTPISTYHMNKKIKIRLSVSLDKISFSIDKLYEEKVNISNPSQYGFIICGLKKNFKINTPKIININKFRGNYSKITNIDSNYMSYPLINKNNLRREVA